MLQFKSFLSSFTIHINYHGLSAFLNFTCKWQYNGTVTLQVLLKACCALTEFICGNYICVETLMNVSPPKQ